MTRETKVGMAVACSFLGLVAAVVVLRMGNPDDVSSTSATSGPVAQAKPISPAGGVGGTPGKPGELPVLQAIYNQQTDLAPLTDPKAQVPGTAPGAAKDPPPPASPSPSTTGPPTPPPPVVAPTSLPAIPAPPPPTVAAVPDHSVPAPVTTPENKNLSGVPAAANVAVAQTKDVTTPPAVVPGPAVPTLPALPPALAASSATPAPPAAVAQINKLSPDEEQRKWLEELKTQKALAQQQEQPAKVTVPSTATPIPAVPTASAPVSAPPAPANDLLPPTVPLPPSPGPGPTPGAVAVVAPPPTAPALVPAPIPVAKEEKHGLPSDPRGSEVMLKGPLGPVDTPSPAPTAVALAPTATGNPPGEQGRQSNPGSDALPPRVPAPQAPLGAPPGGSSAPIAVPVPAGSPSGPAPKVLSWNDQAIKCEAGETSFLQLSKRFYGSEKYAAALLQYNRDPLKVSSNVRENPPRLVPGLVVFVPPTWVLERPQYAAAPAEAPPIDSTSAPAPRPVAPPPPALPAAPRAPETSGGNALATTNASTPNYLVRASGEMLFEIARQTLGDGRRWSEIYRLNPDIRPELAIPGGTQLRLPADARVGS